jgi:hypothetical protein
MQALTSTGTIRDTPDGTGAAAVEPDFDALVSPELGRLFGIAVTILRDRGRRRTRCRRP